MSLGRIYWLTVCLTVLFLAPLAGPPLSAAESCTAPASVQNVEQLRTIGGCTSAFVEVQGYRHAGDGGGGTFQWAPASAHLQEDGGTVFSAAQDGWWVRQRPSDDVVNVKWFGARGDGSDVPKVNARAFNKAIASLENGGIVEVPGPATYIVGGAESRIKLSSNVTLRGTGGRHAAQLKAPKGGGSRMIHVEDGVTNTVVENLKIDLRGTRDYPSGILTAGDKTIIRNNYFYDSTYYLPSSHPAHTGDKNWTRYAVRNLGSDLHLYDNEFHAVQAKVTVVGEQRNIDVLRNRFIDSQAYAITALTSGEDASIENVRIKNNYMYNFWRGGIAAGVDGNSFRGTGNTFKNVEISGNHIVIGPNLMRYRWGIFVRAFGQNGQVMITNNKVEANEPAAGRGGNELKLIRIVRSHTSLLTDLTIRGNELLADQRVNFVVEVTPGATRDLLIENNIGASSSRGISIGTDNHGAVIRGNRVTAPVHVLKVVDSEEVDVSDNVFISKTGKENRFGILLVSSKRLSGRFADNEIRSSGRVPLRAGFGFRGTGVFDLQINGNQVEGRGVEEAYQVNSGIGWPPGVEH